MQQKIESKKRFMHLCSVDSWQLYTGILVEKNQFSSVAQLCCTLCNPMDCSMTGFPVPHQLLVLAQTLVHWVEIMPSNHLNLCCPLLLPSIFPRISVFSNESISHIRWPKYWNFSFNISPSNGYSGLISFEINWFGLLSVQGTLQGRGEGGTQLWLYGFAGNVMFLLFNMLSRFVIVFLPRSKHLLVL